MVAVEGLGDDGQVACEIALGPFGNTGATPRNEDVFREASVGVLDLYEGKLDAAFIEVLEKLQKLAICPGREDASASQAPWSRGIEELGYSPPVLWTFSTLSLEPPSWKAF